MIKKLCDKGIPEHVIADAIMHIWLFMVGYKNNRTTKGKAFNKRFAITGLKAHGKELSKYVKNNLQDSLIWTSKNLQEFLPLELKNEYLKQYVKFSSSDGSLQASEYAVLIYIADLFNIPSNDLLKLIQHHAGIKEDDLESALINRTPSETTLIKFEEVISVLDKSRKEFGLSAREFRTIKREIGSSKLETQRDFTSSKQKTNKKKKKDFPSTIYGRLKQNKALSILLILALIATFVVVLNNQKNKFTNDLEAYSEQLSAEFDKQHQVTKTNLQTSNFDAFQLFDERFDKQTAIVTDSKSYLGVSHNYSYPSKQYLTCLKNDVIETVESKADKQKNEEMYAEFEERFGQSFHSFLESLESSDVSLFKEKYTECSQFFGDREYDTFKKDYWDDIEKVLMNNASVNVEAFIKSNEAERKFENDLQQARNQLRWEYRNTFENEVERNKSAILKEVETETETVTDNLGSWTTTTSQFVYDKEELDQIFNSALVSQWESNSLSTGSMPYASCFGSSNRCSGYSCSKIEITAGSRDVLATIKNGNGRVVRHGYINSRSKYTFEIPNGSYKMFFYSGSGWNPNKEMTSSSCSRLRGGFVNSESFSKDPEVNYLNNQILYYELYEQIDGNFRTGGSSASEAF